MAKDRSEKKEKKEKRKSVDGVKKEKKEKRQTSVDSDAVAALVTKIESAVDADGDVTVADVEVTSSEVPLAALVPFANPLCDDKAGKKVLKSVKKGMSPRFHSHFYLAQCCPLRCN